MATKKRKRTSCGHCTVSGKHRHKNCPGTLPRACAGKPWTCWCAENGHPAVLPPAPTFEVEEKDEAEWVKVDPDGTRTPVGMRDRSEEPDYSEREAEGAKTPKPKKERTDRCGAPTKRGPCNRKAGHTAGHDGR